MAGKMRAVQILRPGFSLQCAQALCRERELS